MLPKGVKSTSFILKDDDNVDIPTGEAAEHINTYFSDIGKNFADKIVVDDVIPDLVLDANDQLFAFRDIILEELNKELLAIDVNKSSGLDDVSSKVLKDCLLGMSEHFLHILNLSIHTGIFPSNWKKGKIPPIPKVNNLSNVTDLRPISLLPITGKILEKFVHKQTSAYLEEIFY